MKQKILALIIGSTLFAAGSAQSATINITGATVGALTTSPEKVIAVNTTALAGNGALCDLAFLSKVGFARPTGDDPAVMSDYIRIELTGAQFTDPTTTTITGKAADGAAAIPATTTAAATLATGSAGSTVAVYKLDLSDTTATPLPFAATNTLEIKLAGGIKSITGNVSVKVTLHDEAGEASSGLNPLSTSSGVIVNQISNDALLSFTSTDRTSKEINPADDKKFVDLVETANTQLSTINSKITGGACDAAGNAVNIFDTLKLEVTGTNLSAFTGSTNTIYSIKDSAAGAAECATTPTNVVKATGIAGNTATFNDVSATILGTINMEAGDSLPLCVNADTTTSMVANDFNCTLTAVGGALAGVKYGPIACGDLQFAGSSDRINYGLTPGGAFRQFFRISNPSSQAGDVTMTVINDAGKSASFGIGKISTVSSDALAAGASTDLIDVVAILAAAKVADSTFDVTGNSKKLRILVRAGFGDDASVAGGTLGDANTTDGVILEAVGISKDNNNFVQGQ